MRDLAWTKSACSSRIPGGEGQISKSMVGMQTSKCRSASIPRRLLTSSRYPLDAVRASIIQSYCSGSKQPGKMVKGETGRGRGWWKRKKKKKRGRKKKTGRRSDVSVCHPQPFASPDFIHLKRTRIRGLIALLLIINYVSFLILIILPFIRLFDAIFVT